LFKSYYVVWKLGRSERRKTIVGLFKSYYVVWKLFFPDSAFLTAPGLNRTM